MKKKLTPLPRNERMNRVQEELDAHIENSDYPMSKSQLLEFADAILNEELSDKHADKMSRNEYPIMSNHQEGRRKEGKQRSRNKSGTVLREVPLSHASNVATDGRDYTLPIRNFKNPF